MKKRAVSMLLTAVMAVTGMAATATVAHAEGEEGKVINIYSWNDEFRTRLEAVYPEVESTSSDGTVTTLKDGTEIHWVINPNQDGVYQQKLDEALMNQADAAADPPPVAVQKKCCAADLCIYANRGGYTQPYPAGTGGWKKSSGSPVRPRNPQYGIFLHQQPG